MYKKKQLPELFYMKHRHDSDTGPSYEDKILTKTLTPYLFNNDMMNSFLLKLQPLMAHFFSRINIIKNFKNFLVDKDK